MIELPTSSRRKFLKNVGYLSVAFPLLTSCHTEEAVEMATRIDYEGDLPRSMRRANKVNAWLQVLEDGRVRILSGKVELGQGIRTALRQVAAEELDMELEQVIVHLAETDFTPDEGYTAGSNSVPSSVMSVRYAAATARQQLIELGSRQLGEPTIDLIFWKGELKSKSSGKALRLNELLANQQIETEVKVPVSVKAKDQHRLVGKPVPRSDIKQMVKGESLYIQDLKFPGMLHARVLRPPNYGSTLELIDTSGLKESVDGVLKTVVNGSFVGVVAEQEYQAAKAERYLKSKAKWDNSRGLTNDKSLFEHIREIAEKPEKVREEGDYRGTQFASEPLRATYKKPYIKHGSMGPACAVAILDGDVLHVWSHSQGIYPMRRALSAMLQMEEEKIHVISVPGAGCYGHSTADDAAADASILALSLPGKHIRVQWSRNDENAWEPYGSAMIVELEAGLDKEGKIAGWKSEVWSDAHSTRPNNDAGTLLTARYLEEPLPMKGRGYLGGGHRNADPYYVIPNMEVYARYFEGPLRVSSLRSLGAYANIFAIESFMDELANRAGKDPIDFRLDHLDDERAKAVLLKIRDMTREVQTGSGQGLGYAFCRYKNSTAYAAVAAHVFVDTEKGQLKLKKLFAAADVGEIINMDGIKNQMEGGMIQAASWTLKEQVTFDEDGVTGTDWATYPILRFDEVPEVEVEMINRPEERAEGGGEVSMPPTGGAISNALYRACGLRAYDLPITAEKLKGV